MIAGIRVKVCGLRSLVDAEAADGVGADYLGFILYPNSPRWITLEQFRSLLPRLPPRQKVAVSVEPRPRRRPFAAEAKGRRLGRTASGRTHRLARRRL